MYGAIVAVMLTTTAPAAPDFCWGFPGFGCGPWVNVGWCGYPAGYGWWGWPSWWGWPGSYGWWGWPVVAGPVVVGGGNPGPSARERDLEAQIRDLREQIRKLRGDKPMEETAAPAPARVVVKLPAEARLFVDDDPCPLTSAERAFDTPDLQPGVTYHYTIRAEVIRDGRVVKESQRVIVRAGKETVVQFNDMSAVTAASR